MTTTVLASPLAVLARLDIEVLPVQEEEELPCNRIVNGKLVPCRWEELTPDEQRAAYCNLFSIYE